MIPLSMCLISSCYRTVSVPGNPLSGFWPNSFLLPVGEGNPSLSRSAKTNKNEAIN